MLENLSYLVKRRSKGKLMRQSHIGLYLGTDNSIASGKPFDGKTASTEILFNPTTRQYLQEYRATYEFKHEYNFGNLHWADPSRMSETGKRRAMWARGFVDRLFGIQSVQELDKLSDPWMKWDKIRAELWRPYWNGEHGDDSKSINAHYNRIKEQFSQIPIPEEIIAYQGDLTDDDLRSMSDSLMWMTRDIKEAIDLLESVPVPVSLEAIFKVQRVLKQPVAPVGGLSAELVDKPSVRRVEFQGKNCIAIDSDNQPAEERVEDSSTEAEWERWNQVGLGTHLNYLRVDRQAKRKTLESGVVHGFHLLGAGDAMLFDPSVSNIGLIVVNDRTRFYQVTLVGESRLDTESFTPEELTTVEKPKPVPVTMMMPNQATAVQKTFNSMDEATQAVVDAIKKIL